VQARVSTAVHLGLFNDPGAVLHLDTSARALAFVHRMTGAETAQARGIGGWALA
jgi:hypothetical protein